MKNSLWSFRVPREDGSTIFTIPFLADSPSSALRMIEEDFFVSLEQGLPHPVTVKGVALYQICHFDSETGYVSSLNRKSKGTNLQPSMLLDFDAEAICNRVMKVHRISKKMRETSSLDDLMETPAETLANFTQLLELEEKDK